MDTIISAKYDESTGESTVVLGTHWGTFKHTVTVDEEDKDVANRWDGCRFAHYLCVVDKLFAKGHALIERSKGINHAAITISRSMYADGVPRIENNQEFNKTLSMMRDQAFYAERDGRKYLEIARKMKKEYPDFINEVLKVRHDYLNYSQDK